VRAAVRHRQSAPAGGASLNYGAYIGDNHVRYFVPNNMCSAEYEDAAYN